MSLSRKLARLETIVAQAEAAVPTFWTAERIEQWSQWVVRMLESMPEQRAVLAYVELTTLPADSWGTLTRVVDREARKAVMGAWDAYIAEGRPVALPEAVCAVLEQHPDADLRSSWDCEECGFETPVRRRPGPEYGRPLLIACPLCDGAVSWIGYDAKRWRAVWEQAR
jgi:hypothetical protein